MRSVRQGTRSPGPPARAEALTCPTCGCRIHTAPPDLWETASWSHVTTLRHQKSFVSAAIFAPRKSKLGIVGYAPATIWNVRPR